MRHAVLYFVTSAYVHVGKHKERVLSFAFSRVKAFAKSPDVTTRLNAKMNSRERLSRLPYRNVGPFLLYAHVGTLHKGQ